MKNFIECGTSRFVHHSRYYYVYQRGLELGGQERDGMNSTEFVVGNMELEINIGRSRLGCRFTERQYEDLYLRVTIPFCAQIGKLHFFRHSISPCTKSTERHILVFLNYPHNLSYLHEVTSISLVTWPTAAARGYVTNGVT
jgi:hypothetical protein